MAAGRVGFIPSRQPVPDWVRNVPVSANGTDTIAKGDAVVMVNGIAVRASSGQDPTNGKGYGVVLAVYTTANRPLTFNTSKIITSAQPGRADVVFDPNQTFYVQCVTSVGPSNINKNVVVDVSSANATTGLSAMSVDIPASASANDYFKIINIGPFDELGGKMGINGGAGGGGPNNGVEVKWNNHFLHAPVAGQ
jgi:hypothetical protein